MVRIMILKGFGPFYNQMGPWMSKYKVLPKEMPGRAVLTGTMWGNVGHTEKFVKRGEKNGPEEYGIIKNVT